MGLSLAAAVLMTAPVMAESAVDTAASTDLASVASRLSESVKNRVAATNGQLAQLGGSPSDQDVITLLSDQAQQEDTGLSDLHDAAGTAEDPAGSPTIGTAIVQTYLNGVSLQSGAGTSDPAQFWTSWDQGARERAEALAAISSINDYASYPSNFDGTDFWSQVANTMCGPDGQVLLPDADDGSNLYLSYFLQNFLSQNGTGVTVDGDWGQGSMAAMYGWEKANGQQMYYLLPRWDTLEMLVKSGKIDEETYSSIDSSVRAQEAVSAYVNGEASPKLYTFAELQSQVQ